MSNKIGMVCVESVYGYDNLYELYEFSEWHKILEGRFPDEEELKKIIAAYLIPLVFWAKLVDDYLVKQLEKMYPKANIYWMDGNGGNCDEQFYRKQHQPYYDRDGYDSVYIHAGEDDWEWYAEAIDRANQELAKELEILKEVR